MGMIWYVLQIAIVIGVVVFNQEINDEPVQPAAAIIVGVGLAAIVTGILYWTIEGSKALFRLLPRRHRHAQRTNEIALSRIRQRHIEK